MALIQTIHGEMDTAQLQRIDGLVDDDVERTTTVEYCLLDCPGDAHRTGIAQGIGCFCSHNVHRSVNMTLKQGIELVPAIQGF
jgi:hypothetical protein